MEAAEHGAAPAHEAHVELVGRVEECLTERVLGICFVKLLKPLDIKVPAPHLGLVIRARKVVDYAFLGQRRVVRDRKERGIDLDQVVEPCLASLFIHDLVDHQDLEIPHVHGQRPPTERRLGG